MVKVSGFLMTIAVFFVVSLVIPSYGQMGGGMMGGGYPDYYGHRYGMGYGAGCFDTADSMKEELGLSNDQVNKIRTIDSEYRDKYYQSRSNYDDIEKLREEHKKAIKGVLEKAQMEKYETYYSQRWYGRGTGYGHMGYYYGQGYGMGYGSGCFNDVDSMRTDLNLSKEQQKKIAKIDSEYRAKYYENRGNYDKIDSLRIEHRKAIEKVLKKDQIKKYNEYYNNRWFRGGRGMMGY